MDFPSTTTPVSEGENNGVGQSIFCRSEGQGLALMDSVIRVGNHESVRKTSFESLDPIASRQSRDRSSQPVPGHLLDYDLCALDRGTRARRQDGPLKRCRGRSISDLTKVLKRETK
jgi:hypothetical protein